MPPEDEGAPAPEGTETPPATPESTATEVTDWQARASELEAEVDKWKGLSRRHEERRHVDGWLSPDDAKALRESLAGLETDRDEARRLLAERDVSEVETASDVAVARLHVKLARAGIAEEQVEALTSVLDPMRLLKDGRPDTEAITAVADSIAKSAGRIPPDPDQGSTSGAPAPGINDLLRVAVRGR